MSGCSSYPVGALPDICYPRFRHPCFPLGRTTRLHHRVQVVHGLCLQRGQGQFVLGVLLDGLRDQGFLLAQRQ
jgi:hypothetical protein